MRNTLQPGELEQMTSILPKKEQTQLREHPLSKNELEERIHRSKKLMQRDVWVGLIWLAAYTWSLLANGFSNFTIGIFVTGAVYFTYTMFTSGSYGLHRKRIRVYEQLLKKSEKT